MDMARDCPRSCDEDLVESDLRGRKLLEDVLPEALAAELFHFAPRAVIWGDGYDEGRAPMSGAERFGGVTPAAAARWAAAQPSEDGLRERAMEWAWQLISACYRVKAETEHAFNLTAELSADFFHLTCRQHIDDSGAAGDSHPVHADNCYQQGAECVRGPPMFHWRSHSSILALSSPGEDSFSGGDFYYTTSWEGGPRTRLTPKAGRMVSFTAGPENLHGVCAVTAGIRCQLSAWFTEDAGLAGHAAELQAAEEVLRSADDRHRAAGVLHQLCSGRAPGSAVPASSPERPGAMFDLASGLSVSVDILGRPAAPQVARLQGLLTPEECKHVLAKGVQRIAGTASSKGWLAGDAASQTAWLEEDAEDAVLSRIRQRVQLVTGMTLTSRDQLQVSRYSEGGAEPHQLWGLGGPAREGLLATLLVYLAAPEAGGAAAFDASDLRVSPEAGAALFWYDMLPSGTPDGLLRGGVCPVLKGQAHVLTVSFHRRSNGAVLDAAAGLARAHHLWRPLAGRSRAEGSLAGSPSVCGARREAGHCSRLPLEMVRACPGICDEREVHSELRGRTLLEGVLTAAEAERLAALAPRAVKLGDGYGGSPRPLAPRERFWGLALGAAVEWAVAQPLDSGHRAKALAWARTYATAVSSLRKAVSEHFGLAPAAALLDFVHLTCREQAGEASRAGAYSMHDGYLLAGDGILQGLMTLAEAQERCAGLHQCVGFTFHGRGASLPQGKATVYLKRRWQLQGGAASGWSSLRRERASGGAESQPVHAEDCCWEGGRCRRAQPCRYWRTHSAVLFLHGPGGGDFAGGSFFFSPAWDSPEAERVHVEPRAGRAVAFTSGVENLNGVAAVTNGTLCALSLWLTDDRHLAGAAGLLEEVEEALGAAEAATAAGLPQEL